MCQRLNELCRCRGGSRFRNNNAVARSAALLRPLPKKKRKKNGVEQGALIYTMGIQWYHRFARLKNSRLIFGEQCIYLDSAAFWRAAYFLESVNFASAIFTCLPSLFFLCWSLLPSFFGSCSFGTRTDQYLPFLSSLSPLRVFLSCFLYFRTFLLTCESSSMTSNSKENINIFAQAICNAFSDMLHHKGPFSNHIIALPRNVFLVTSCLFLTLLKKTITPFLVAVVVPLFQFAEVHLSLHG